MNISPFVSLRLISSIGTLFCVLLVPILFTESAKNKVSGQNPQNQQTDSSPHRGVRIYMPAIPDSPLIAVTETDVLPATKSFRVNLTVKNVSEKAIRAYTIRYDVVADGDDSNGSEMSMFMSPKSMIFPGQSKNSGVGGNQNYSAYIDSIRISIDFVEFDDGTTWGRDTFKSAERLAGWRAGAKAIRQYLSQKLQSSELVLFMNELESEEFEFPIPPDKSEIWVQGYKSGVSSLRARVRNAQQRGNREDIEKAIKMPIDASERR